MATHVSEIFLGGPDRVDGQLEIVIRKSEDHLHFCAVRVREINREQKVLFEIE